MINITPWVFPIFFSWVEMLTPLLKSTLSYNSYAKSPVAHAIIFFHDLHNWLAMLMRTSRPSWHIFLCAPKRLRSLIRSNAEEFWTARTMIENAIARTKDQRFLGVNCLTYTFEIKLQIGCWLNCHILYITIYTSSVS